jgi:pimeloyl-ACP methyl ester carboxylesterase
MGLAVMAVVGLAVGPACAADKDDKDNDKYKRVIIPTVDGVDLEGTYYPNPGGRKEACVLLLHNFDKANGGDSHKDGWDHLAEALQKKGYAVLSFDFRGFGESKKVNPEKFWRYPHNQVVKPVEKSVKDRIDQKYFPPQYYAVLVNDIAAAKAFLDRRNDAREVNTSNLIVVGAGEGATLGALWLSTQCRLQKDKQPPGPGGLAIGLPMLDDPESKDVACAAWLTVSPTLAGRSMAGQVKSCLQDAVRLGKIRMAFVYGAGDKAGETVAKDYAEHVIGRDPKNDYKLMVARQPIAGTKLTGSKLLDETLDTEKWIIDTLLDNALEKRTNVEWKRRDIEKYRYFWALPKPGPGARLSLAKPPGEELPGLIPGTFFGGQ